MLTFIHPSLSCRKDLIGYRREVIASDGDFDGTAGLGNFPEIKDWLELLFAMEPIRAPKYGYYPTLVYLAYDGDVLTGIFNVRLDNGDEIRNRAGHIGYHVRPSMRKKGYARLLLREAVTTCREHGIADPVVCTVPDNIPSGRTALSCGFMRTDDGILENGETVHRYVYSRADV